MTPKKFKKTSVNFLRCKQISLRVPTVFDQQLGKCGVWNLEGEGLNSQKQRFPRRRLKKKSAQCDYVEYVYSRQIASFIRDVL